MMSGSVHPTSGPVTFCSACFGNFTWSAWQGYIWSIFSLLSSGPFTLFILGVVIPALLVRFLRMRFSAMSSTVISILVVPAFILSLWAVAQAIILFHGHTHGFSLECRG